MDLRCNLTFVEYVSYNQKRISFRMILFNLLLDMLQLVSVLLGLRFYYLLKFVRSLHLSACHLASADIVASTSGKMYTNYFI